MRDPLKYAFTLLRFRFRTEKELRRKMKQKGFSEEEIESVIVFLKEKGLLNERLLAEELVEKYRSRGVAPRKIERILKSLGAENGVVSETLETLETNEEVLLKIVEKISGGSKKLDKKTFRRIMNKLAYLGYNVQEIFDFLKKYGFDLDFSDFSE